MIAQMIAAVLMLQVWQWQPVAQLPLANTFTNTNTIKKTSTLALDVQTDGAASFFKVDTSTPNVAITQLTDVSTRLFSFRPLAFGTIEAASNAPMRGFNFYLSAPNAQSGKRPNRAYSGGYNVTADNTGLEFADDFGIHMFRLETAYNGSGAERWVEGHLFQIATTNGSAATGNFYRPIALTYKWPNFTGIGEPTTVAIDLQGTAINLNSAGTSGSGTNWVNVASTGANFKIPLSILSADGNTQYWKFSSNALYMKDSTAAIKDFTNNLNLFKNDGTGNLTISSAAKSTTVAGTLDVTGVATFTAKPILSSLTASQAVFSDGSKGLVSNAITGTGNVVMSASPTLTGTIAGASQTLSGTLAVTGGLTQGSAAAGDAATTQVMTFQKTGCADSPTAQAMFYINIPTGNQAATIDVSMLGVDTGYNQSRCARAMLSIGRNGSNAAAVGVTAIAQNTVAATLAGGTTLGTLAYTVTQVSDLIWAFNITPDTGDGSTSILTCTATVTNSKAGGVTLGAAP